MDSILATDQDLVTEAVHTLALNTITAYQNGAALEWNDAELAVYLVYIFGEINKCECSSIRVFGPACHSSSLQHRGGKAVLPFAKHRPLTKMSGRWSTMQITH